jgi:membrane fusion protein, adhesin transport system
MAPRDHDLDRLAREMQGRSSWRGSALLLLIALFLACALVWAARTELDDVTRAQGRIMVSKDNQLIQAAEPGVLEKLYVAEGDIVEAGAVLMELDGSTLAGQLAQELQRAYSLRARITRLRAEIDETALMFPQELLQFAPMVVSSETALFNARKNQLEDRLIVLKRQRSQRAEQIQEASAELQTAQETLALFAEQRAIIAPFVERGIEPEISLIELRRSETEWRGRLAAARAALARVQSALAESDDEMRALMSQFRADALAELVKTTSDLSALEPSLPALESRAERTQLRAPVRGVVNRILRSTIGSLARAGEDLIEIVPIDEVTLVEAFVRPQDIAFIYTGQPVKVKVTAFDFTRYGSLDGEITRISADTVTRSARNEEEFFVVQIRTKGNIVDGQGKPVQITPGMVTEVDILAGKKTILEYLTRPVIRIRDTALRE